MASFNNNALAHWNQALADCLAAAASADFLPGLIRALQCLVPVESVLLGLECHEKPPRLLYHCGVPAEYQPTLLQRYYARGYLLDPFCLAIDKGLPEGFYPLAQIAPDDFLRSEYYRVYYQGCGSMEDAHFIVDLDSARKISLCVYQGQSGARFRRQELALLQGSWAIVRELLRQFDRQGGLFACLCGEAGETPKPPATSGLEQKIRSVFEDLPHAHLTEREQDVAHLLLCGHSVKSSARMLAISPETVRMHRKHLYGKLHINSQAELFALFIASTR